MPANLPPQYYEVEKKYRAARDPHEKLAYLQELLAIIPKHKGTEKIQGELKAKISKVKDTLENVRKTGGPSSAWYQIDRQGAGQVVITGLPNSGKTSVLNSLTNANAAVADYPFTTAAPQVGMMKFEDVLIQIIDTPPLADDTPAWLFSIYRSADLLLIVLDATDAPAVQFEIIAEMLAGRGVIIAPDRGANAKAVVLVNKAAPQSTGTGPDDPDPCRNLPVLSITRLDPVAVEPLKKVIFERLEVIRVYTKKIGQAPLRQDPVVVKTGTTVIEAAEYIHKDFRQKLQYTRLWNADGFSGQRVEKNHVLKDGDIIEFHV